MAALTPSFAVATAAGSVAGCFLYSAVKLRRTSQFFTERRGVDSGHNTALAKDFLDLNSSDPLDSLSENLTPHPEESFRLTVTPQC
jgi:hypothetical protein